MVIPGSTISVEIGAARDGVVAFGVRNADGDPAIARGVVQLSPGREDGAR
jgi:hypothetical protein